MGSQAWRVVGVGLIKIINFQIKDDIKISFLLLSISKFQTKISPGSKG